MRLIVLSAVLLLCSSFVIIAQISDSDSPVRRNYGSASVSKFVETGKGLEFICCVDEWPDVVGRDIKVKIARLDEPQGVGEDKDFYHKQLAIFLKEKLAGSKIELHNISRDADSFAIVADVKVGGLYLAPLLIKQGLAVQEVVEKATAEPTEPTEPVGEPEKSAPEQIQPPQQSAPQAPSQQREAEFVCSRNSDVFHKNDCPSAKRISSENIVYFQTREEAIEADKKPCKRCNP
jgi:hypothetical protein